MSKSIIEQLSSCYKEVREKKERYKEESRKSIRNY